MNQEIILVNLHDEPVGYAAKEAVHRTGALHRAFSVFLYHEDHMLIQQRALHKYHSGGLWANTCCSHPRRGESLQEAVRRRLQEETGIVCEVNEIFSFVYYQSFHAQMAEHELDHVFVGEYAGEVTANPEEVAAVRWISFSALEKELMEMPEMFASWFHIAAPRVLEYLRDA